MVFEDIYEPVEVISYFDNRQMRPLRFRWKGRTYKIAQTNGVWSDVKGRTREYHFHVKTVKSGSFELIFNNTTFAWKLGRAYFED